MRAYKNVHLLIGMVWTWEMGQILWQDIRKKQVIELNKLRRGNPRISTPTDGSTGNEWHNIMEMRRLYVRIHRLLYQRYTKSRCHYLRGNDILFTPYLTLHKLNVGNIGVDREVRIELSNQSNRRGCSTSKSGNQPLLSKFLQISGSTSSRITLHSAQTGLNTISFSLASWFFLNLNLSLWKLEKDGVEVFSTLVFLTMILRV